MLEVMNWLVSLIFSLYPAVGYQASVSPVRDPVLNPIVSPIIPAPTARPFWGLTFDGGDYAQSSSIFMDDANLTWTWEAWINRTNVGALQCIYSEGHTSAIQVMYIQTDAASGAIPDTLVLFIHGNSAVVTINSGLPCPSEKWIYVAVRKHSATTYSFSVDNDSSLVLTVTNPGALAADANRVGGSARQHNGSVSGFTGKVTMMRIWNIVKTHQSLLATKYNPTLGTQTGLVLEYPFFPGSGTVITDNSGNVRNMVFGATTAAPKWVGPYTRLGSAGPQ